MYIHTYIHSNTHAYTYIKSPIVTVSWAMLCFLPCSCTCGSLFRKHDSVLPKGLSQMSMDISDCYNWVEVIFLSRRSRPGLLSNILQHTKLLSVKNYPASNVNSHSARLRQWAQENSAICLSGFHDMVTCEASSLILLIRVGSLGHSTFLAFSNDHSCN